MSIKNGKGKVKTIGGYRNIGIAIDAKHVVYVQLLKTGEIFIRFLVERDYVDHNRIFSIRSKSEKMSVQADILNQHGFRICGMNLARFVYKYMTGKEIEPGNVIHHKYGQAVCLMSQMESIPTAEHNGKRCKVNKGAEAYLLEKVVTLEQYNDILIPNIEMLLGLRLKSNYLWVNGICLYETKLSDFSCWEEFVGAEP